MASSISEKISDSIRAGSTSVEASGTMHQGSDVFNTARNAQCVPTAACAMAWGLTSGEFSSDAIDILLYDGFQLYTHLTNERPQLQIDSFMEPTSLPDQFSVFAQPVMVQNITDVRGGVFPSNGTDVASAHNLLVLNLAEVVSYEGVCTGWFFTGQTYTVSFWRTPGGYLLFNPHGVNRFNVHDLECEANNVARLFRCTDIQSLAWLLLSNAACDGAQRAYTITAMHIGLTMAGVECVATGSLHQGDPVFFSRSLNKQSAAVSLTALAFQHLGQHFETASIDDTIHSGDQLYLELRRNDLEFVPDDFPCELRVKFQTLRITEKTQIFAHTYPMCEVQFQAALAFVHRKLYAAFSQSPPNSGFLFVTPRGTVAFWEQQGVFNVFEPQGVTESGRAHACHMEENLARLFRCDNVESLSKFLLIHEIEPDDDLHFFAVHRVRFGQTRGHSRNAPATDDMVDQTGATSSSGEDLPLASRIRRHRPVKATEKPAHPCVPSSDDEETPLSARLPPPKAPPAKKRHPMASPSDDDSDTPLITRIRTTSVSSNSDLSDTSETSSVSSSQTNPLSKGTGRPVKRKRGRPKTSHLTKKEQQAQASKKYYETHKKSHRDAAARYQQENAEVHRDAVARYQQEHPEKREQINARYRAANPQIDKIRYLSPEMRTAVRQDGPMAFWSGDQLNRIQPHRLQKPCLFQADIYKCQHCGASLFEEEKNKLMWCCGGGAYNVLDLPPLTHDFYESPEFLDRARAYNDMLAFCAMGVSGGYQHPSGLAFLKIQGRMYHQIHSLGARGQSFRTTAGQQYINHCRLYVDDGAERAAIAEGRGLKPAIVRAAADYLDSIPNPFLREFRKLGEEPSLDAHLEFQLTSRETHGPTLGDSNPGLEVHAVLNTEASAAGGPRKLSIWKRADARPSYIDVFSPLMEPFQYPLLYPHGTLGWHVGRLDNKGNKLSQYKYARCLLLSEPRFFELGRLSQAWMVEMFARFEEERLRYISRCQKGTTANPRGVRVAPRDELLEQVQANERRQIRQEIAADETVQGEGGINAGKVYLPSSFTGSPRYMKTQYLNAMGLVARKGKPTYFLTFTACGQWEELKKSTRHGTKCDPATCSRIFHIKLQELLRDIRSGALFGPTAYIVYVIEMQMRGLPHAHIAIRVEDDGPKQGLDIDTVIRADIPGEEEAGGRLRKLVLKHMVHGPCGTDHRTDLPCWDAKKKYCKKFFPKPETQSTYIDDKGFVHHRRDYKNKATTFYRNRPVEIHDGWVVPYNAALLLKYECHINLELASTRRVIKYLFKYLSKGSSLQNVRVVPLHQQQDEPEEYATRRMIGASDACWRLLDFDLTVSEPTAEMLPVHLEGEQSVMFVPGQEAEAVDSSTSKLLLYFNRPHGDVFDNLTYQNFNENFIIHTSSPARSLVRVYPHPDGKHFVTARQRKEKITRLFWVAPNKGELYYLRVLLLTVPCRGFADLKSRGGPDCDTFQGAARVLGLVENEREHFESLAEAATFMTGPSLRSFFVLLCNIGAPAALLWEEMKDRLSEDFLERHPDDPEKAYKLALIQVDRCLRRNGSRLTDQGLPNVQDDSTELGRERLNYSVQIQQAFVQEWEPRLDPEQRALFEYVKVLSRQDTPSQHHPRTIFLSSPGGYGKTALLNVIISYLRSQQKVVLCVASSGIAALNMPGGMTAHKMFGIPLDLKDGTAVWSITNGSQRAELIREASMIIMDEAPMAHKHILELLDRSLRDLMQNDQPFGGKIVLLSGDFRQIPPVVQQAKTPNDVIDASIKSSELWPLIRTFTLRTPQRTRGDPEYSRFLLSVGDGTAPEVTLTDGDTPAVQVVPLNNFEAIRDTDELVNAVYPPEILTRSDECAKRAILAPLNSNVAEINEMVLDMLEGPTHEMLSCDSVDKEDDDGLSVDASILHQATAKGVPPHSLKLKVGAVCLITRNLNVDQGLVNGTKVIIQAISPYLIRVRKANDDETFAIPRISFKFELTPGSPLKVLRRQFPLQLAYAMTVHKSQGQTIDFVGIDLRTEAFTHGQLYVALSRVRSREHIRILVHNSRIKDGVMHTTNVVYKGLLD